MSVSSVMSVPSVEVSDTSSPSAPMPSRDAAPADDPPRAYSIAGRPLTWTGRIVSLDEWRTLSEWDRHAPDGRLFCGACREWVMPGACPHTDGGAA